jgi:hypothetical protein
MRKEGRGLNTFLVFSSSPFFLSFPQEESGRRGERGETEGRNREGFCIEREEGKKQTLGRIYTFFSQQMGEKKKRNKQKKTKKNITK